MLVWRFQINRTCKKLISALSKVRCKNNFFLPSPYHTPQRLQKLYRSHPAYRVFTDCFFLMFNIMPMHVMFRLVGGDASPSSPPPKSATAYITSCVEAIFFSIFFFFSHEKQYFQYFFLTRKASKQSKRTHHEPVS